MANRAAHYLLLKSWTPYNKQNQQRIWIAEQTKKENERREKERSEAIAQQADRDETARLLRGADITDIANNRSHPLNFMYAAPVGATRDDGVAGGAGTGSAGAGASAPARDEESARFLAAYRAASSAVGGGVAGAARSADDSMQDAGAGGEPDAVLAGASSSSAAASAAPTAPRLTDPSSLSALEREAGKRKGPTLSVSEMHERFPFLKNAPMEMFAKNVQVTFHPVGQEVKNVRCIKCRAWGHEAADRECPLRGAQTAKDTARLAREDPMAAISAADAAMRAESAQAALQVANLPPAAAAVLARIGGGKGGGLGTAAGQPVQALPPGASSGAAAAAAGAAAGAAGASVLRLKASALAGLESSVTPLLLGAGAGPAGAAAAAAAGLAAGTRGYSYLPLEDDGAADPERAGRKLQVQLEARAAAALSVVEDGWGGVGPPLEDDGDRDGGGAGRGRGPTLLGMGAAGGAEAEEAFLASLSREERAALLVKLQQGDAAAKEPREGDGAGEGGGEGRRGHHRRHHHRHHRRHGGRHHHHGGRHRSQEASSSASSSSSASDGEGSRRRGRQHGRRRSRSRSRSREKKERRGEEGLRGDERKPRR
jgi:hypothetical protein